MVCKFTPDSFRQSILTGSKICQILLSRDERRQQQRIEYHNLISAQSTF